MVTAAKISALSEKNLTFKSKSAEALAEGENRELAKLYEAGTAFETEANNSGIDPAPVVDAVFTIADVVGNADNANPDNVAAVQSAIAVLYPGASPLFNQALAFVQAEKAQSTFVDTVIPEDTTDPGNGGG